MKTKILALLLCLVMVLGLLASCGGDSGPGDDPAPGPGPDEICDHEDITGDGKCDKCGEVMDEECDHVDEDNNLRCDLCREKLECPNHKDLDGDGICNHCKQRYDTWDDLTVQWETTDLIFKLTENSNGEELPSTCKRYMAGEDTSQNETIDTKVRLRNEKAYSKTKVYVKYDYYTDDKKYGWGSCIEDIFNSVESGSSDSPDMFCNFVYDMVAVSLKGGFANLYSTVRGTGNLAGVNYFQFIDPKYEDSGSGYMVEYMKSLSLSKHKMYCLASDYFTDMVRAFFVVPVNIKLINQIPVDLSTDNAFNSDRTEDGKFTIEDFYELVLDGQWNYTTLAQFSAKITQDSGEDTSTTTLDDTVGFAISSSSGLSASGMVYTTSVTVINREWSDAIQDYTYYYPNPTTDEGAKDIADLVSLCNNLNTLFNQKGIISVNNLDPECQKYSQSTGSSLTAIRNRFANNTVLFGGVICLGSLEYDEYQAMKEDKQGGFGVVPAPLYRDVNPETNTPDKYLTQIHNIGRIGAISAKTYKFAQCTAFLDYMSTHSTEILNEYYNYKLKYDIAGGTSGANGNATMLEYIRANVRSSFDKAYEDAIGKYFSGVDTESNNNKWHEMIRQAAFKMQDMQSRYDGIYSTKEQYLKNIWNDFNSLPD